MPYVLSLSPVRISTLSGHTVAVAPGIPAFCPEAILKDALAAGCMLCNEKGEALLNGRAFRLVEVPVEAQAEAQAPAAASTAPAPADNREAKIAAAVAALSEAGNPKDFNAITGALKVGVVSEKCGFKVSAEEIRNAQPTAVAA